MTDLYRLENLLSLIKEMIHHQNEVERVKGETFNVFSILKMERKENATHSAFLGELLNPNGSHLKGNSFLKLFLKSINHKGELDDTATRVFLEYYIGERNDEQKSGGRIDIVLADHQNCLSIENKIDAGDQNTQVERYCNFRKLKNTVYYLTLQGDEPSDFSKGNLESGKDFYLLSYRNDVIPWLELCLKEAADAPIVRETIKQYIILLRKMTSSMNNQEDNKLVNLLLNHFEEASYIAANINKARGMLRESVRRQVAKILNEKLSSKFELKVGDKIDSKYAQIWIWFRELPEAQLHFGVESFSGMGNHGGNVFVGIFNRGGSQNSYTLEKGGASRFWYDEHFIEWQGGPLNFNNDLLLTQIQQNTGYAEKLAEHIASETISFIAKQESVLSTHIKRQSAQAERQVLP